MTAASSSPNCDVMASNGVLSSHAISMMRDSSASDSCISTHLQYREYVIEIVYASSWKRQFNGAQGVFPVVPDHSPRRGTVNVFGGSDSCRLDGAKRNPGRAVTHCPMAPGNAVPGFRYRFIRATTSEKGLALRYPGPYPSDHSRTRRL